MRLNCILKACGRNVHNLYNILVSHRCAEPGCPKFLR